MFSNHLSSIDGVHIFAIIALLVFVVIFCVGVFKAFSIDKAYIDEVSQLPLEDDQKFRTGDDNYE